MLALADRGVVGGGEGFFTIFTSRPEVTLKVQGWNKRTGPPRERVLNPGLAWLVLWLGGRGAWVGKMVWCLDPGLPAPPPGLCSCRG